MNSILDSSDYLAFMKSRQLNYILLDGFDMKECSKIFKKFNFQKACIVKLELNSTFYFGVTVKI